MKNSNDESDILPNAAAIKVLHKLLEAKFPGREYTFGIRHATSKGDNFVGVVYRITVRFNNACDAEGNPLSLILKVSPENVVRRKQFFTRSFFLRESLAYTEFIPLVRDFQHSKGIFDGFYHYAECYGTVTEDMQEAIFLEDLCEQQFALFDRFASLQRSQVELVMRSYAKLHAVSFAIKDQQPEKMQKFQNIVELFEQRKDDVSLGAYFETLKSNTLACLDKTADKHYIQVLEKYFAGGTFFELLLPLLDGKSCEPYAVICHGDGWINNILFKHDERGNAIDVRLIDWQILRYASPITDLMYFLFTSTTQQFRKDNLKQMLNIYYTELSNHLIKLGSDPNTQYPREYFDEQIKSKSAVGLHFAMILLPIITMKSEDMPNLEKLCARIEAGATTDLRESGFLGDNNLNAYSQLMRGTVVDCIDFGYV